MIGKCFINAEFFYLFYRFFRDSLLATLLDAVRSSGNMDVHVKSSNSERNKRVVPLNVSVDEETEANLLRFIIHFYQYPVKRAEVLDRFNANIPYSGLNYSVSQDVSFSCTTNFLDF